MRRRKVIDMPEEQFVGALERQVDTLSSRVEDALREGEHQRDNRGLVKEAERLLRGGALAALGGRANGIRHGRKAGAKRRVAPGERGLPRRSR